MKQESLAEKVKETAQGIFLAGLVAAGSLVAENSIRSVVVARQSIISNPAELLAQAQNGRYPFDVIAVFGAGTVITPAGIKPDRDGKLRALAGEYALENNLAPYITFLGKTDPEKGDPAPGQATLDYATRDFSLRRPHDNFPLRQIVTESMDDPSTNTEQNVASLKNIMSKHCFRSALLISNQEHLMGVLTNAGNFRVEGQALSAESVLDFAGVDYSDLSTPARENARKYLHEGKRYIYLTFDPYSRLERAVHADSKEEAFKLLTSP
jgi:uncharacterized SAM-binding protein YcdF (DUF218 family)